MSESHSSQPNDSANSADANNPYASPLNVETSKPEQTARYPLEPTVPWSPGWAVVLPAAIAASIVVIVLSFSLQSLILNVVVLPCLAMATLAALVKFLHSETKAVLPIYILVSLAAGFASYVLFVPVCIATFLPIAIVGSVPGGLFGQAAEVIAFTVPLAITFSLFTLFLRRYLRYRHRYNLYQEFRQTGETKLEPPSDANNPYST